MGRHWYEDGKLLKKINTFTDYIAVTDYLVANKYAAKDKVFGMGGSAGGLLMGAVANAALVAGGEVIGVIPEQLMGWEVAHKGLTRLEVVANMHERKMMMFERSDAFVVLPGGMYGDKLAVQARELRPGLSGLLSGCAGRGVRLPARVLCREGLASAPRAARPGGT